MNEIWEFVRGTLRLTGNRLVLAVIVPILFFIAGIFAGGYGWQEKQICILVGTSIATVLFLWLAWRVAPVGIGVTTLSARARGTGSLSGALGAGVDIYIRLISAVLTSEIALGLMLLVIPTHLSPILSLFLIPICIGLFTWSLWQGGVVLWPKIAGKVLSVAAVLIVGWVIALAVMPNVINNQFGKTSLDQDLRIVDASLLQECLGRVRRDADEIHDGARIVGGYSDSDASILGIIAEKEAECTRKYQDPDSLQRLFAWFQKRLKFESGSPAVGGVRRPSWTLPQFNLPPAEFMKRVAIIGVILFIIIFLVRKRKSLFSDVGNWMIIILAFVGIGALVMWAVPSVWASFAASSTYTMLFGSYHPWG